MTAMSKQREAARRVGLANRKHGEGQERSPEYRSWDGMRDRCLNEKSAPYADYGGRGITVCSRWRGPDGYENFLADMGRKPSPHHTLDRRDNGGNYTPENCRWATKKEQASNRRDNVRLTFNGETHLLRDWAARLELPYNTLYNRLARGWSVARALQK